MVTAVVVIACGMGCGMAPPVPTSKRDHSQQKQRVAEYRRPLPVGEPLDQNAAVWYRLAFAKTAMQPADTAETLGAAVKAGAHDDSSRRSQLLREHCGEVRSARVQRALACTH